MIKRYRIVGICKNDEAYEELKEKPDGDLMYYTDYEKLADIVRKLPHHEACEMLRFGWDCDCYYGDAMELIDE